MTHKTSKLSIFSWCMYDWANSAFNTVIGTFIFSVYFARGIVGDEAWGSSLWGYAVGASGIAIAILSPIFGSIADKTGKRKIWLALFTQITVLFTLLLVMAEPDPSFIKYTLIVFFFANIAFEIAGVFYNSMLTDIAPPDKIGRVSGLAWGLGYIGGLACLVTALFVLVGIGKTPPFIAFPTDNAAHIRASALLVGMWMMIFSMPVFLFCREHDKKKVSAIRAARQGIGELCGTLKSVRKYKNVCLYLVSSALFRDGLNTLFAVGGLYAAGTYGMKYDEILLFAVGLNVTSGIGAAAFAFVDDRIGSKKTIIISLLGLLATGLPILFMTDKNAFMIAALLLGIFVGPAQAASRTLMARIAPEDKQGEFFGLYAFTGKSIAFLGPICFAALTQFGGSQRFGMASILTFIAAGLVTMIWVKEKKD